VIARLMLLVMLLGMLSIPADAQQVARTKVTLTTVSCGAASGAALAANDNRNFLMVQNDHATQVIYLQVDAVATLNAGIRVNAVGGTVIFSPVVPLGAITCIATGATTPLLITEGVNR
jgi:hypothetical protein